MGGDGKIDGKIIIQKNQGISQAIRDELNLTQEQCNRLGRSVWEEIFKQVDEQQKQGQIYEGGNDAFSNYSSNYIVHENQVIEFATAIWEKIVKLVNDKLGTNIKTDSTYEVDEVRDKTQNDPPINQDGDVSTEDIKVKVPHAYMSNEAKGYIKGHQEGAKLKENIMKKTNYINASYISSAYDETINFGPNTRKQAKVVFEALVRAMRMEGLLKDTDYNDWDKFSKLAIKEQNKILHKYRKRLARYENEIINTSKKNRDYHNSNINKIQKTFDDANAFLVEVANMKDKPTIKKGYSQKCKCNYKMAELSDGRWIRVHYNEQGEISEILISHDTTPDKHSDKSESDQNDVKYSKDSAKYNIDHNREGYEGSITSGYDFEKLKAIAEKIFGKWEE